MRWEHRPARDFGLRPLERLRSLGRERGLVGLATHWCWLGGARLYLRLAHRIRVEGRQHLPTRPPFVLIANHASHLDALALCTALGTRAGLRTFPLAAADTFFTNAGSSAFASFAVNALPVWRGRTQRHDLALLRERLLADGIGYVLFPEGTRSRDGRMAAFRPGLGALVAGTDVPVIPCRLTGAFEAWPATRRWPHPGRRLRLVIGPPLRFAEVPNNAAGWAAIAARCEAAVRALSEGE